MPSIIGYTYDADSWCVRCAQRTHAYQCPHEPTDAQGERTRVDVGIRSCDRDDMLDEHGISQTARDRSGDMLHPVFSTDAVDPEYGLSCGNCGRYIVEPSVIMCGCGDGCPEDDCPNCDDIEPGDEDEDFEEARGCTCPDCEAAAAWTPDVA